MIRIHNVRGEIKENINIYELAAHKLKVNPNQIKEVKIHKKSIDARNKKYFSYCFDLDVLIDNENKYLGKNIDIVNDEEYKPPVMGNEKLEKRPIIVGSGPAGLFCAYKLAEYGYKPLIIERGEKIEDRIKSVENFWQTGNLNKNSNVQYGEGGAGTFSDGKLNTLVKDKAGRMKEVFKIFVECGAPENIMYDHEPHIGTDILRSVVINLRKKIISMGGEFKYNTFMNDIKIEQDKITGIYVDNQFIEADILVLAIGHSARDTFRLLERKAFKITPKPFAVGVRIIHPQEMINKNQYPINYSFLPSASYKLTYKCHNGKGVYSFCMCPGGYVVDARSSHNFVVVNGMSNNQRDSGYANSAIIVTITPDDYGTNPLDGVIFQENIEKRAYEIGKGKIPCQSFKSFKENTIDSKISNEGIKGCINPSNINSIFPQIINDSLKEGIEHFSTKITGFNEGIILAPESRTSSPITIVRDENLESNIKGVYPCGEGAGYAGGITTSAVDGLKVFEAIRIKYQSVDNTDN